MRNLRLRKMLRDLWNDKSRTLLAVLSIAVGVFALSLTLRARAVLSENMLASYAAINPADATLSLTPFDQLLVDEIRRRPDVRAVQGLSHLDLRIRIGEQWRQLLLTAIPDFKTMQVNRLAPAEGAWPPPPRTMLLERSFLDAAGVGIGDSLVIQTPDGHEYHLPVAGLTHDLTAVSGQLGNPILSGYVSLDTAAWLGLTEHMNTLQIVVGGDRSDAAHVRNIVNAVGTQIDGIQTRVLGTIMHDPTKPPLYDLVTSILDTLRALGVLSLVLSTLLIINTIAGLLARQVPQIGVLKAIGAARRDIVLIYLGGVLVLAVLALLVALPLAVLGSRALTVQLARLLNFDIHSFSVPPYVLASEMFAGLIVPLLVGLYPILAGTRLTVRQALTHESSDQFGRSLLDRLMGRVRGGPVTQVYALRNMVRRKGRLALTLAVLVLGGAITIAVVSVRASLFNTLDQAAGYWQQDITVTFDRQRRVDTIVHQAMQVPGVVRVEDQPAQLAVRQRSDGSDAEQFSAIFGVRPDSLLLRPTIVQGRWLTPDDTEALVVNVNFLKHEPDLRVGDAVTLKIGALETDWRIVGVVTPQLFNYRNPAPDQGIVYASSTALARAISQVASTDRVLIVTERHDSAFQDQVAQSLVAQFERRNIQILTQTRASIRGQAEGVISAIVLLLLVMVCMFVLVGGLSQMGAMSLNVLDRIKEIGVLRAIGASTSSLLWIVLTEGLYTGVFSWLLATLLAIPLSRIISDLIGWSIVSRPLVYTFPPLASLIWLGIAVVLAAAASYLPAASAARLSVRDVLAHE